MRHKRTAQRAVIGTTCILNISFEHTNGEYVDAEHLLKPLGIHIYETPEKTPQQVTVL
jgi:hypothetical protein